MQQKKSMSFRRVISSSAHKQRYSHRSLAPNEAENAHLTITNRFIVSRTPSLEPKHKVKITLPLQVLEGSNQSENQTIRTIQESSRKKIFRPSFINSSVVKVNVPEQSQEPSSNFKAFQVRNLRNPSFLLHKEKTERSSPALQDYKHKNNKEYPSNSIFAKKTSRLNEFYSKSSKLQNPVLRSYRARLTIYY